MSAYSDLILAHGSLRAYYRLGESLVAEGMQDAGPNNLDGTYAITGITYGVSGAIVNDADTALTFSGDSDPGTRLDDNALDLGNGPLSLECWIKRSATQGASQVLLSKAGGGGYQLSFTAGNRVSLGKDGTGSVALSTGTITDTTTFHHLVVTKDGSARKVYVDGADVTTLLTDSTLADTTSSLFIGHAGGTLRYPGSMDEIAIYGGVLTPAEVLNHYEMGLGIRRLAGSSVGLGAITGELVIGRPLVGTIAGQGMVTGDVIVSHPLAGSSTGTSSSTADLLLVKVLEGASAGSSTVAGDVTVSRPLAGTSTGIGTATGNLTGNWLLAGTSTGVGVASGALTVTVPRWDMDAQTRWLASAGTRWPAGTDNRWS